jgi:thiol-disulfide isomerase/thioredoxin
VGLYFGAPWCGYCVRFTPYLAALYSQAPKDKLEIVFVSSCSTQEEHRDYTKDMPWYCVPFREAERIGYIRKAIRDQTGKPQGRLATLFGVQSLPSLIILNSAGKVVRHDGRQDFQTQSNIIDVLRVWEESLRAQRSATDRHSGAQWAAAGVALLGLGGVCLWRSSGRGGRQL